MGFRLGRIFKKFKAEYDDKDPENELVQEFTKESKKEEKRDDPWDGDPDLRVWQGEG